MLTIFIPLVWQGQFECPVHIIGLLVELKHQMYLKLGYNFGSYTRAPILMLLSLHFPQHKSNFIHVPHQTYDINSCISSNFTSDFAAASTQNGIHLKTRTKYKVIWSCWLFKRIKDEYFGFAVIRCQAQADPYVKQWILRRSNVGLFNLIFNFLELYCKENIDLNILKWVTQFISSRIHTIVRSEYIHL